MAAILEATLAQDYYDKRVFAPKQTCVPIQCLHMIPEDFIL